MARDIENVNITLPGESDTIELIVDGEPTEVVIALDSWASAVHADDADTVSGHTVARDVLADEYTNAQIDSMVETAGTVKTVNTVQPDQNGNVQITKADIGLGNVDNTSDADKPISTAAQAALDLKVDKVNGKGLSTNDYTDADKTKLGDLPTDAEITAALAGKVDKETGKGLSTNDFTDAEKSKLQGIETGAQVNTVTGVKGSAESTYRTGDIDITKANVGLYNVDNTSDLNKPISTATQAALDGKVDKVNGKGLSTEDFTTSEKTKLDALPTNDDLTAALNGKVNTTEVGVANGIAELDSTGKVPSSQLPSYVDDVIEYASRSTFPAEGEDGKIYIAKDTNLTYRWGGTEYVEISPSLALGETSSTAYRGDRGKTAYDHSQTVSGNPHNVTKTDVGLGNVDNTSDANKPVSTATQNALDAKSNLANIAVVESGTTASQSYTVGKFVCVNGNLYKVIDDIAQGDTFTVGTNISTDTIGAELTALNTGLTALSNQKADKTYVDNGLANQKYFYIDSEGYGCINYDLFQTA